MHTCWAAHTKSVLPLPRLMLFLSLRNVTIRGQPGVVPPVMLDLAYRRAIVLLCPTCTVTFKDLTLRNARRGAGPAVDFVVGEENTQHAAVLIKGVYRHRLACTTSGDLSDVLRNTPRSKYLPRSPTGKQMYFTKATEFQVRRRLFTYGCAAGSLC